MNYSIIRYMLGHVTFTLGVSMLFPCLIAGIYQEHSGLAYLACSIFCIIAGKLLSYKKPVNTSFFAKEGFLVVALSWVLISLIGAIPLYVTGEFPTFTDALFEMTSGFTTTGASVSSNVEVLSHSTLLWRSFSHWFGGMGVLVFILALLPMTGGQSLYFMKAESPGPSIGKQVPRMQKTAKYLYLIYLFLTILMFIFLLFGDMNIFDCLCTSLATAGTGGFGNSVNSIGNFNTYTQIVITIFMFLFGINFNMYFFIILKKFKDAFSIEEVKWYFTIYLSGVFLITINLTSMGDNFFKNLLDSAFHSASVMTTTGFSTVDFNLWPNFSKVILLMLMFVGGCAGSTSGGIKVSRIMMYLKTVKKELQHLIHPNNVKVINFEGKPLNHDVLRSVNIFLIAYLLIYVFSVLIVSLDGFDAATTFSSVLATLNNVGPGLGEAGPMGGFGNFSTLSKYVFIFDMLAGRLEIFPMLILFLPSAWRSKR